jgi:hypothetical protein
VIEWGVGIGATPEPPRARAAVLSVGQAQVAVVASGSDAEAAALVIRCVEAARTGWREAGKPDTWCAPLREADRLMADAGG